METTAAKNQIQNKQTVRVTRNKFYRRFIENLTVSRQETTKTLKNTFQRSPGSQCLQLGRQMYSREVTTDHLLIFLGQFAKIFKKKQSFYKSVKRT